MTEMYAWIDQVNQIAGEAEKPIGKKAMDPRLVSCMVGGQKVEFLIDSGARVNTMTLEAYKRLLKNGRNIIKDHKTDVNDELRAYAVSSPLDIICTFKADVTVCGREKNTAVAKFYVISGASLSLLSYDTSLQLNLLRVGLVASVERSAKVQKPELFPRIPIPPIKIRVSTDVHPVQTCRYNIPLALEEGVRAKIREMLLMGIIEEAKQPTWISAMHVVPKGVSGFRIVIDYRDLNKTIPKDPFPMPHPDRILNKIGEATVFTKLDLSSAYHHIELHPESRKLTGFMTEMGVMQFTRLPFGISCAPELFQRIMESLFRNLDGVAVFLDDILIYAETIGELRSRTQRVIEIIRDNNLTLNQEKCEFEKNSIEFLGFKIDGRGIEPSDDKIKAVTSFVAPKNKKDLRSFLGMVQFLSPFIKGLSTLTAPLRELLAKDVKCRWESEQEKAFESIKRIVANDIRKRGIFDPKLQTELITDASPVGLGSVLMQTGGNGDKRLIACASKSLTETEQKYSQTQREALAAVWGVEKFSYYLLGKDFTLVTDHEALKFIFGKEARAKPGRVMSRAEGWALRLAPYSFKVAFIAGERNIADPASRLVRKGGQEEFDKDPSPHELFAVDLEEDSQRKWLALTWDQIFEAMLEDKEIELIAKALKNQSRLWPEEISKYKAFQDQMVLRDDGLILKQEKLVLPKALRQGALVAAHTGHAGMSKMKNLLRRHVWWLGIDREVENFVRKCVACQLTAGLPRPEPIQLTDLPIKPWDFVAIDFHSPDMKRHILVVTDCYSRFLITVPMKKTDTEATKNVLSRIFATYGRPKTIKSDNGAPFNASELEKWLVSLGIKMVHSTPWNPTENGMVERQNQGIKKALRCAEIEKIGWEEALRTYTSAFNSWVHDTTLTAPAELFFGRPLQGWLPNLRKEQEGKEDGEIRDNDRLKKFIRKTYQDRKRRARDSDIEVGDTVLIWNTRLRNGKGGFESKNYKVVKRDGGRLTVRDKDGVQFIRSTKHAVRSNAADELRESTEKIDSDSAARGNKAIKYDLGGCFSGINTQ